MDKSQSEDDYYNQIFSNKADIIPKTPNEASKAEDDYYNQIFSADKPDWKAKTTQYLTENPSIMPKEVGEFADKATGGIVPKVARGVAQGVGEIVDLGNLGAAAIDKSISMLPLSQDTKDTYNKKVDDDLSSNYGKQITDWFDSISDDKYAPKTTTDKVINTAASFAVPMSGFGKVKTIAKSIPAAVGGATALETTRGQHFLPEGLPAREIIEDVTKTMLGAASPAVMGRMLSKMKNSFVGAISGADGETKEILKYAEQEGIDLPHHVATNNSTSKLLANNIFKSYFISKTWKEVLQNSNDQMITAVSKNIDNVSRNLSTKEDLSALFKDQMEVVYSNIHAKSKVLYDKAAESGKNIKITQDNKQPIKDAVAKIKKKFHPDRLGQDDGALLVYKKALEVEKAFSSKPLLIGGDKLKVTRKNNIEELVDQRSSLLKTSKYGAVDGNEAWLTTLTRGIEKTLDNVAADNPKSNFSNEYKEAQSFWRNEYVSRAKTKISKAITTGEVPKEVYSYMNSTGSIDILTKMIGTDKKSKAILQDLKRAKLQEILADKVFKDGSLSHANLSTLFNNKSTSQGILEKLLGNDGYNSLKRLATLSARFKKSGIDYANPSGTAQAANDISKVQTLVQSVIGAGAIGASAFKTAGATVATPYLLSKIYSNKNITDKLVELTMNKTNSKSNKRDYKLLEGAISGILNNASN